MNNNAEPYRYQGAVPVSTSIEMRSAISAMFSVPVMPYMERIAMSIVNEPSMFKTRYLNVASILSDAFVTEEFSFAITSPQEESRRISKNTKRLNKSPVKNAPFSPATMRLNNG